jgi:hypothetical protein
LIMVDVVDAVDESCSGSLAGVCWWGGAGSMLGSYRYGVLQYSGIFMLVVHGASWLYALRPVPT